MFIGIEGICGLRFFEVIVSTHAAVVVALGNILCTSVDREVLSPEISAATDAWACIQLYEELQRLERTRDFRLVEEVVADNFN